MNPQRFFVVMMALVLAIFVISLAPAFGQVDTAWVRRYNAAGNGSDGGNDMFVDASGNVYVTGYSKIGDDPSDYTTIKYNAQGETVWVRHLNRWPYDGAEAIALGSNGNVYVTGSSDLNGTNSDFMTVGYSPNGDSLWTSLLGSPDHVSDAHAIAVDANNNVYVTGSSEDEYDAYNQTTVKYDSNGNSLWVRYYIDDRTSAGGRAIAVDRNGYIYTAGSAGGKITGVMTVVKYNPNGDTLWARVYYGGAWSPREASDLTIDSAGYVYVTGRGPNVCTTIKYNPNGDTMWLREVDAAYDVVYWSAIAVANSGNVYVTVGDNDDYKTIKYSPNGNLMWTRYYNGPGNGVDIPSDITLDRGENVYVTGASTGIGSYFDIATIKYTADGDSVWTQCYNGPGNDYDGANKIAIDDSENVYVTGSSVGIGTYSDIVTIKYIPTYGLFSPNGGEAWQAGHQYPITWSFQGFTGNVRIDCSINSGASFDYIIVSSYPNTGEYLWTVPIWTYSNHCRVRVCDAVDCNPVDSSDSDFTIYICGDVTKDGVVDASDLISVLNYLFAHGPVPPWPAGDVNSDGTVDASDLIYLLNYLFAHGPAPICLLRL